MKNVTNKLKTQTQLILKVKFEWELVFHTDARNNHKAFNG